MNKMKTICENNKILKVCCKILSLKYAKIKLLSLVSNNSNSLITESVRGRTLG